MNKKHIEDCCGTRVNSAWHTRFRVILNRVLHMLGVSGDVLRFCNSLLEHNFSFAAEIGFLLATIFIVMPIQSALAIQPVKGQIDGVFSANGQFSVYGWACAQGENSPIMVNLYVGHPPTQGGVKIGSVLAKQQREAAVGQVCSSASSAHGFVFPLANPTIKMFGGYQVYAVAVSPDGVSFASLGFSLPYNLPTAQTAGILPPSQMQGAWPPPIFQAPTQSITLASFGVYPSVYGSVNNPSNPAIFPETVAPLSSFGVQPNTGSDVTAQINAALASLSAGQALGFSAGVYYISSALVVPSSVSLEGQLDSTGLPLTNVTPIPGYNGAAFPMVSNANTDIVGAIAFGGNDLGNKINMALTQLTSGQTLIFSPGVYYVYMSSALKVPSNIGLQGPQDSNGNPLTVIMPYPGPFGNYFPLQPTVAGQYSRAALANFQLVENYSHPENVSNQTVQPMVDSNITLTSLGFNYNNGIGNVAIGGAALAVEMRNVNGVTIRGCSFNAGGDGTAMLGSQNTLVQNCYATNTHNAAYDHWDGTMNALVMDSIANIANGYGILFNGIDTDGTPRTSTSFTVMNNYISGNFGAQCVAIWVDPLSSQANIAGDIKIQNNIIESNQPAPTSWSDIFGGIVIGQNTANSIVIQGNLITGMQGFDTIAMGSIGSSTSTQIVGNYLVGNTTWQNVGSLISATGTNIQVSDNYDDANGYGYFLSDTSTVPADVYAFSNLTTAGASAQTMNVTIANLFNESQLSANVNQLKTISQNIRNVYWSLYPAPGSWTDITSQLTSYGTIFPFGNSPYDLWDNHLQVIGQGGTAFWVYYWLNNGFLSSSSCVDFAQNVQSKISGVQIYFENGNNTAWVPLATSSTGYQTYDRMTNTITSAGGCNALTYRF